MASARTLHVRCTTWDQVDVFLTRKLRKGKFLSMKVPFSAKSGLPVTLGLELPNEVVVAIEGIVQKSSAVQGEPSRTWIEVELTGLTEEVLARIRALGSKRKKSQAEADAPVQARTPTKPPRPSTAPTFEELPGDERDLFQHLTGELRRLRQAAVHEVLGVARDADADAVRAAWKTLVRRYHPDLVSRRSAPARPERSAAASPRADASAPVRACRRSGCPRSRRASRAGSPPSGRSRSRDLPRRAPRAVDRTRGSRGSAAPRRGGRSPAPSGATLGPAIAARPSATSELRMRSYARFARIVSSSARCVIAGALRRATRSG